jgi:hypothetical protein
MGRGKVCIVEKAGSLYMRFELCRVTLTVGVQLTTHAKDAVPPSSTSSIPQPYSWTFVLQPLTEAVHATALVDSNNMAEQESKTDGDSQNTVYRQLESYDWEKDKEFQV